jgi:hypothetical protein
MNYKTNHPIAYIIDLSIIIVLLASGCSFAVTPSPTLLPPTPVLSTSTPIRPTPPPDLIGFVAAYEDAVRNHDLEAMVSSFADNAKFQWGSWTTTITKQEIIDLHNYFIGVNEEIQNSDCSVQGSVVSCQAVFRDDCTQSAGMDGERYSTIEYSFENGKITKITSIELTEDFYPLNGFYINMLNWGNRTYPEEYAKLLTPSGTMSWDQESGVIMSQFCQEYVYKKP